MTEQQIIDVLVLLLKGEIQPSITDKAFEQLRFEVANFEELNRCDYVRNEIENLPFLVNGYWNQL